MSVYGYSKNLALAQRGGLAEEPDKLRLLEELGTGAEEPGELGTGVEERAVAHT